MGAANRDPDRFESPDTIILDAGTRPTHMAFGKGMHLCVGHRDASAVQKSALIDSRSGSVPELRCCTAPV
ncbi:hypothetical protein [Williamsia sp.]|uniref:hypothetical protein n=1 Tax=Williamsia sp. TaxID=1872085 RepID=UPI002F924968